jgi:hypothetical protein
VQALEAHLRPTGALGAVLISAYGGLALLVLMIGLAVVALGIALGARTPSFPTAPSAASSGTRRRRRCSNTPVAKAQGDDTRQGAVTASRALPPLVGSGAEGVGAARREPGTAAPVAA